jgi:thiamine biosynthesis lipoprotein
MKRALCLILICTFLLAGCQSQAKQTVFAMDTVMDLQIWGKNSEEALAEVKALILDTESKWSAHIENSIISSANRGESVDDPLLEEVRQLSIRTGGAFDPQLYSVTQLWNFTGQEHTIPTEEQIRKGKEQKLWDLGGAVKGYAGQLAVERLQTLDVSHAILNLGGNVQTYGSKPNGELWSIGIQNPDGGDNIGIVSVVGTMAVVTSGDYQRYFEKDGVRYHHILDPQTGMPADSGLCSVTVISRNGLRADCLSTALYVMGLEQGSEFWRQSDDFEAVFITDEGSVYATEGAALSGCEYEVIAREN